MFSVSICFSMFLLEIMIVFAGFWSDTASRRVTTFVSLSEPFKPCAEATKYPIDLKNPSNPFHPLRANPSAISLSWLHQMCSSFFGSSENKIRPIRAAHRPFDGDGRRSTAVNWFWRPPVPTRTFTLIS
ncbi:hypothetical protein K443DRAFT_319739 [Laccaria amethystina LaAM-08-1]|uniref:Secreted protein n=1 Tax=Laccaria amethystina LaAM-08-1 TaxID=1095629 RepID=A0A0C9XLU9_9AGAR|nr:hypothetical protein K443DRAFT_319739 [Laccaria amethystina LaAM-08-1]